MQNPIRALAKYASTYDQLCAAYEQTQSPAVQTALEGMRELRDTLTRLGSVIDSQNQLLESRLTITDKK